MPASHEISETLIRENITRAIGDVFKTMIGRSISLSGADDGVDGSWPQTRPITADQIVPQVVGTVGFLGDVNGLIYLYFDSSFANECVGHLLSMTEDELTEAGEEVVNDAVGELTNMIVGSFKNGLCDAGFECKLTIPSILRGRNFSVEPISSAMRHIYSFECQGRRVVTDILMNKGD